jgi:RHS repeat-associated protein
MSLRLRRGLHPAHRVLTLALILTVLSAGLPALPRASVIPSFLPEAASAETLSNPKFVSAAVMPSGEVGLLYANGDNGVNTAAEIRFSRYTAEHALSPSVQLSTAGPAYPQLATFRGRLVAGYVDTRSPNAGKFVVRASDDSGATWSAESFLFSGATFDPWTFAPRLVSSRDGLTLYFFSAAADTVPQYRSTTDSTLAIWSSPAAAGGASMRPAKNNSCGSSGQECYRAHAYSFMETATAGTWIYIAKSDAGFAQSGRGTQVGTLGGTWSAQVDLGGSGGLDGCCGESTATTFLDRAGAIYYLRAGSKGEYLYWQKSTDGGASWSAQVGAYLPGIANYTTAAPVGLYDARYTRGEYVWYAGFSGGENALRVLPLWEGPQAYSESGTVRLLGSLGGDLDAGSPYEYNFGNLARSIGVGSYVTGATDLALPGRLMPLAFTRAYSSADGFDSGPLGPAWTHSYHWWLTDSGSVVTIQRGTGKQDRFTRNADSTYASAPGVFDTLVKNVDASYTLTSRDQVSYDFTGGRLIKIREPAGNQITLGYTGPNLVRIPYGGAASYSASRCCTLGYEPDKAANGKIGNTNAGGWSWQVGNYLVGDWWRVTWSAPQSLTRVRLWDFEAAGHYYGQGHLEFSDASSVTFGPIPNDAGPSGEDFREISFPRKSGITWMKVVTDSLGFGYPGLSEVEAYDDESAAPSFGSRLNVITDSVGRRVLLGYASDANLALRKPYTQSVAPDPSFPDTGGTELTDGLRGDSPLYNDLSWQGHQNLVAPLDVTVDLGTAQPIGLVRSHYFHFPNDAIYRPASVELLTSTDNSTFTSRGTMLAADSVNDAGRRFVYDISANVTARWVRLRITKGGLWLFSSEITVGPRGAVAPSATIGDRLISVTDPLGRRISYRYDNSGRLATVVDRLGNSPGVDPELHKWVYSYDGASNHIATITDPDGRTVVTNTYDSLGRLTTQKDGLLSTTTFGYPTGQLTITDPRSHVTTQSFDARSRLISVVDAVGSSTYTAAFTYDGCGNRSSATDRRGSRTDYTYDNGCKGNLLEKKEPQLDPLTPRFTTTFVYDAKNNLSQVTDARGSISTHTYHPTSNVRLSTASQIDATTSATTKYEYGDAANPGLVTRVIAPRGNLTGTPDYAYSTAVSYDSSGNLIQKIDADSAKTTYGYDTVGRRTSLVDPDGYAAGGVPAEHTWTTVYDANDQVTSDTNPLSQTASSTYDGAGNRRTATDRRGNLTTYLYDAAARLWKVQQKPDPLGQPTLVYETVVGRDANGNATSVTQANGALTDYGYDAINRLTTTTVHPATGVNLTTTLVLDGNGSVTSRTTADNVTAAYTYDALSRLKTVSATGLATITYAYDELSRRSSMQDGTGTTTYGYDRLSRLTNAAQPNGTTGYAYDRDSNRTSITYPGTGGGTVTYAYSNGGRLTSLTDWSFRGSTYTYTAAGLAKTLAVPGGMTTTYGYDRAQRLVSLTNAVGAITVSSHAYTLDAEGNRTALAEYLSGVTLPNTTEAFGFSYDGLNRLTGVTTTNPEAFTLDGASNITARTGPPATYTIDAANRPTSDGLQAFTWSNADRLVARGADSFGYDPLDRLTSSAVAGTARTYAYNGDGLLQSATEAAVTTALLWDPASSPSRLLQRGDDRVIYGLGPLYVVQAGDTTLALARDGGKSVRAEVDGTGAVTGSWRYRAYGEIAQGGPGPLVPVLLGYAGQLLDPSGLYYMRARWYDPATARFLSRDPVAGLPSSPGTLNSFGYVAGRPTSFADPSGACADPDPDATDVRYCIAAFIPYRWIFLPHRGFLKGDSRGPAANSGTARVTLQIRADGSLTYYSDESARSWNGDEIERATASPTCERDGGTYTCSGSHPFVSASRLGRRYSDPPVQFSVTIGDDGSVTASGGHFPSLEVWRYVGGQADLAFYYNSRTELVGPFAIMNRGSLPNHAR